MGIKTQTKNEEFPKSTNSELPNGKGPRRQKEEDLNASFGQKEENRLWVGEKVQF